MRGINVMAEIDVPGHRESWGIGYPDLLAFNFFFKELYFYMREIFPFELFHLGGDEVNTDLFDPFVSPRVYHQLFQIHRQLFDEIPLRDVSLPRSYWIRFFLPGNLRYSDSGVSSLFLFFRFHLLTTASTLFSPVSIDGGNPSLPHNDTLILSFLILDSKDESRFTHSQIRSITPPTLHPNRNATAAFTVFRIGPPRCRVFGERVDRSIVVDVQNHSSRRCWRSPKFHNLFLIVFGFSFSSSDSWFEFLLGYIPVTCKVVNVRSGDELLEKCRQLAMHFETQGTPIMIVEAQESQIWNGNSVNSYPNNSR
ncbi:hypothetical protein L1887_01201 [Cichorium endivia]|nr:hypothetical protein L1887_01201 [Cichorium endivia]